MSLIVMHNNRVHAKTKSGAIIKNYYFVLMVVGGDCTKFARQ